MSTIKIEKNGKTWTFDWSGQFASAQGNQVEVSDTAGQHITDDPAEAVAFAADLTARAR